MDKISFGNATVEKHEGVFKLTAKAHGREYSVSWKADNAHAERFAERSLIEAMTDNVEKNIRECLSRIRD